MTRRIRVLHPLSAWGGAHVQTCINILSGMTRAGAEVHLDLPRTRVGMGAIPHRVSIGWPMARFGLRRLEPALVRRTEARFLAGLCDGDVAWLWPEVGLDVYREVARRGHPIVMEGINTRIASARRVLEAVHAAEGLAFDLPAYSRDRIAAEEEMLSMASHIFSPSPVVDAALAEAGSSFSGEVMASSYGAWLPPEDAVARPRATGPLTVLFAGTVGLRKNAHGLLDAWVRLAPKAARLVIAGAVSPEIATLRAEALARDDVEVLGHVSDMGAVFRDADLFVMPSFEEGDPQVTYEAAGHGLPIVASVAGGGRLAERTDAVRLIDAWDIDAMAGAIDAMLSDASLRAEAAAISRSAAARFDWNDVGAERKALLDRALP